jgi:hypothetical protein
MRMIRDLVLEHVVTLSLTLAHESFRPLHYALVTSLLQGNEGRAGSALAGRGLAYRRRPVLALPRRVQIDPPNLTVSRERSIELPSALRG